MPDFRLIKSGDELVTAIPALAAEPVIGLDTETTGLDPHKARLRLLQLATPQQVYVIDCFTFDVGQVTQLVDLLTGTAPLKIAHNAKFDAKFLHQHAGIRLAGIFDTYLASLLVSAGNEADRHGLEPVVARYLGRALDKAMQQSDWSAELSDHQLEYAARDASILLPLQEKLQERLDEMDLLVTADLEFDCILSIARMELAGVYLDERMWREQIERTRAAHELVAAELQEALSAGASQMSLFELPRELINLDSPVQVRDALARLGIEVEDTREWRLQKLAREHPILDKLLEHRHLSKNLSSYGESVLEFINPVTGRIHADFRQIGTPTGRMTSSSPSLQQIPHTVEYRSCFRAPAGKKLIVADYSQIEMRILADFAHDESLLAAFDSGQDLHRTTASQMFGIPLSQVTPRHREQAKGLNYGLVYGMGAEGLASRIESTVPEAESLIDRYFNAYAGVARWLHEAADHAVEEGRSRTASGRLWIFRLDPLDRQQYGALKRVGKNAPIQGTASDIFKRAMALLDLALLPHDARIVNSIHDELVIECEESIADEVREIVLDRMISAAKEFLVRVPVTVEAVVSDAWLKK